MRAKLKDKVALVTGASSGIGAATAVALAKQGAHVALVARREDRLKKLAAQIEKFGGDALSLPCDVSDEGAATAIVQESADRFGRLDVLVNSAGVIEAGGVENADTDAWREVIDINLMATLYTSKAAIGLMKASGGGDIVNVSSTAGRRATGVFGPYSTSKFGLSGLTEGMRQELGSQGIRVAIVEPGATTTEVAERISDPHLRQAMFQHVSKDGAMLPEDVADAIVFIISLPPRANVSQLLIRPMIDVAPL